MQVMHHEWSKKLDNDVLYQLSPDTPPSSVPCWQMCESEHRKALQEAHTLHSQAQQEGHDPMEFNPYTWSLPHLKYEDVKAMLRDVRQMRPPYVPRSQRAASETASPAEASPPTDAPGNLNVQMSTESPMVSAHSSENEGFSEPGLSAEDMDDSAGDLRGHGMEPPPQAAAVAV